MRHITTTSDGQISLFGEDASTFSPAASPASRSRRRVKEKEPMTTDTSGRLCLEQLGKSVPDGSWARMLSELLIGMPGWYSTRCALIWKLKATKSNRLYCQLQASTLPTDGTGRSLLPTVTTTNARQGLNSRNGNGEPLLPMAAMMMPTPTAQDFKLRGPNSNQQGLPEFIRGILPTPNAVEGTKSARTYNPNSQMGKGLSALALNDMLPTPQASDGMGGVYKVTGRYVTRPSGHTFSACLRDLAGSGLLPTPEASHYKNGHRTVSPRIERKVQQGWAIGLNDMATLKMLPTPTATDWKPSFSPQGMTRKDGKTRDDLLRNIPVMIGEHCKQSTGTTSQLNPLFVEEMMSFPAGWILLPFLRESPDQPERTLSTAGELNP